jgi:hypothetical protein
MARAGSRSSLVDASENLLTYARLEVTPKQVQRVAEDVGRAVEDWNGRQDAAPPGSQDSPATVPILYVSFDGTGVPMRKSELHSSKCKGPDGKARTREVKLACIFTPNTTLTFSTATSFSGTTSSARFSGSTAGLFDPGSGPSVGGGGGPIREIAIPVPAGAKVPALFQDDTPKPPQQLKALDRIASEFEQNVSEIPAGMTQEDVWEAARLIADERYITLFGYQAYNQYHIKAAKEALKEKRARSNATGP